MAANSMHEQPERHLERTPDQTPRVDDRQRSGSRLWLAVAGLVVVLVLGIWALRDLGHLNTTASHLSQQVAQGNQSLNQISAQIARLKRATADGFAGLHADLTRILALLQQLVGRLTA